MNPSLFNKLKVLQNRFEELTNLLSNTSIIADQNQFRSYSKEYTEIKPVTDSYEELLRAERDLNGAEILIKDDDPEVREMAYDEVKESKVKLAYLEKKIQEMLLPRDPNEGRNVFLEIRAGTGGNEAAIFAGDLFRMYSRYAERRSWKMEILSESSGEYGGYKEIITRIEGNHTYRELKYESGVHRVQRVPSTETQGRIHTSACTVAILPEIDQEQEIQINPSDLRVDTYRSSGAGGQHVNKTDSAIRITHFPSGTVVECQQERSQHKNRARAMSWLASKLQDKKDKERRDAIASTRKVLVGLGDRSERIRTYNFAQGRVTDHRIGLTLYALDEILSGGIDVIIKPLISEGQAEQLTALGLECSL